MLYKLVFNWIGLFLCMTLVLCLCDLVTGYRLPGEAEVEKRDVDWGAIHRMLEEIVYREDVRKESSIERFAQEEICGTVDGKVHFVQELNGILSPSLRGHLKGRDADFFILEFVEDLCRPCEGDCEAHKNMLTNWVGLVYDSDNNKSIDSDERRFSVNANYRSRG